VGEVGLQVSKRTHHGAMLILPHAIKDFSQVSTVREFSFKQKGYELQQICLKHCKGLGFVYKELFSTAVQKLNGANLKPRPLTNLQCMSKGTTLHYGISVEGNHGKCHEDTWTRTQGRDGRTYKSSSEQYEAIKILSVAHGPLFLILLHEATATHFLCPLWQGTKKSTIT
jgi:hypothetical protein